MILLKIMATVKELKEHYRMFKLPSDGSYLVYNKNEGSGQRSVYKYLCSLNKKGGSFSIHNENKYHSNIDKIIQSINDYIKNLEFDSEYYDRSLRDGVFEEHIVHDYLIDKGFIHDLGIGSEMDVYTLKDKTIYGNTQKSIVLIINDLKSFSYQYKHNKLPENISISIHNDDNSFIKTKCKREVHEIIAKIDSLLKPYFIYESSKNIQHSEKFNFEQFDATINTIDYNTLNTLTKEYKSELKEKLQTMLDAL